MVSHEFMMDLTRDMPHKLISVNEKPYLSRYYAGTFSGDDRDLWFHHFHSADGDRHVHSHPFDFITTVLRGWYREEIHPEWLKEAYEEFSFESPSIKEEYVSAAISRAGDNCVPTFCQCFGRYRPAAHWHRIAEVAPDTWTMVVVDPARHEEWHFRGPDGTLKAEKSSGRFWWRDYGPRKDPI